MFKRILSIIEQNTTNAFRDNIVIYMLVIPIILAIGVKMLIPSIGSSQIKFAVEENVGTSLIQQLKNYGQIETLPTRAAVLERVNLIDDVPGIVNDNGKIDVLLEGNENPDIEKLVNIILSTVLSEESPVKINEVPIKSKKFPIEGYAVILLIFMVIMMGALLSGFNIVEERESGAIRALAVSPLTFFQYIFACSLLIFLTGVVLTFLMTFIMRTTPGSYFELFAGVLFSTTIGIVFSLIIGLLAENQLTAIAVMKVLGFVYLTLPLVSIFVSNRLQFLFYLFPNYWMFQMFKSLYIPDHLFGFWLSGILTLLSGFVLLIISVPFVRRKLRLKNF
jgi:ABC-2 type transport system permease protein